MQDGSERVCDDTGAVNICPCDPSSPLVSLTSFHCYPLDSFVPHVPSDSSIVQPSGDVFAGIPGRGSSSSDGVRDSCFPLVPSAPVSEAVASCNENPSGDTNIECLTSQLHAKTRHFSEEMPWPGLDFDMLLLMATSLSLHIF